MKRYANPAKTALFTAIAAALMIIVHSFYNPFDFEKPPEVAGPYRIIVNSEIQDYESVKKIERVKKEFAVSDIDLPQPDPVKNNALAVAKISEPAQLKIRKDIIPAVKHVPGTGKVVIIIDDMGMDRKHSLQVIDLPEPLTLAFLPYAPKLKEITRQATEKGHELIIHVPMQPIDSSLDPGPLVLRDDMTEQSFHQMLDVIYASFDGYVGINNHMGSKLTQDQEAMDMVMETLAQRGLMFVDSKTIASSVAKQSAADHGLEYAERDVFLDNENVKPVVMKALQELEIIAKRRGYAIAIGHPREATIQALREWLPTLKERGLTLVPVSAVTRRLHMAGAEAEIEPAARSEPYSVIRPSASSDRQELFGPVQATVLQP